MPGCLSCPLPAAGRSPEVLPSRRLSAVPGLAPVGPVSSRSFPSYCFPGSLRLQQLFTSLGSPFFGRGLSFSPAALSQPPSRSSPSPAALFIPPATAYRAASPPQAARRALTLPLQLTQRPLDTPGSLHVERKSPVTARCGLVQHNTLVRPILFQQKVQQRERAAMQDTLKNNFSLLHINLSLKCRFVCLKPLG